MTQRSVRTRRALLLFVAAAVVFELAIWNARIANSDSLQQLRSAIHLVDSGRLGITDAEFRSQILPAGVRVAGASNPIQTWTRGGDGRWYQIHDPGNKALMVPAAIVATLTGRQSGDRLEPTTTTKLLASASIVAFGVLLPVFLYLALAIIVSRQQAMRWAALGVVATILLPYSKSTWDVFPCAVVIAALGWWSLRRLSRQATALPDSVVLFAMAAIAGWFRFSIAAFLVVGCVLVECLTARGDVEQGRFLAVARRVAVGLATSAVVLVPVFVANESATGNPFKPPTALYDSTGDLLARFPLSGAIGLLASPNRGLLVFSPFLVVVVATAWLWRTLPGALRSFIVVWGIAIGGYVLAVGSVRSWGGFGWGPRYLVPVIPLLWIPTAYVGTRAMASSRPIRVATVALVALSIACAVIPTLTNWEAVAATSGEVAAQGTDSPKQLVETVRYTGRRIPVEDDLGIDAGIDTKQWPDLAAVYAARKADVPDALGYLVVVALLTGAGVLFLAADRMLGPLRSPDVPQHH